ncbi:MAG TPA: helicase-related protein [Gemmataceae bacterium]|jgi:superfamily II DNA/RNA helicase
MTARERLRFALIKDGPKLPGGRLVGIQTAPITPWPHQAVVARRLVETWPYSYLLCDEVGLGKTIEGGLALRSLILSGVVKRVLIAAPASLTGQWQRELATKFFLPFALALPGAGRRHRFLFPNAREVSAPALYAPDLVIVSTGLLTRTERQPDLRNAKPFDIVLLDEAHYARRENPTRGTAVEPRYGHLYETVRDLLRKKAECLWLATATPMQLDSIEVADLVQLSNRVGAFQHDPTLLLSYYDILGKLTAEEEPTAEDWDFLRRAVAAIELQDPILWRFLQHAVVDGRIRVAVRQWLEQKRNPKGNDRRNMLRLIFAGAPLSRVMLRHTRRLLEIYQQNGRLGANLARRHILAVPRIVFTEQEDRCYKQLEQYCQGLAQQVAAHASTRNRAAVGFLLSFLRLRFASSLFAARETLRRRRERVQATLSAHLVDAGDEDLDLEAFVTGDDDSSDEDAIAALLHDRSPEDLAWERQRLDEMLQTLSDLSGPSPKMVAFLQALQWRRFEGQPARLKQTVVFTRFYDTLTDIVRRLRQLQPDLRLGTFSGQGGQYVDPERGQMVSVDRDEVKHRFLRGEIDLLICTDAAAEGLNLQTANLLINFDLPWNPMKVEQRIGRIDRIGQRHAEVYVLNLCYVDSVEQMVYERLLRRLKETEGVVGTQQISLLPVTLEEFQQLADGTLSEQELEQRARQRLREFQRRAAAMEIRPEDLYEIYLRLTEEGRQEPPVDLDAIWTTLRESNYLRQRGCVVQDGPEGATLTVRGIAGLMLDSLLTASRGLFEKGLPGQERCLGFASYGDPTFEAILTQVEGLLLPRCARRLSVALEGYPAEVVGYAVAVRKGDGTRGIELLTSWRQLQTLELDEEAELTEADIEPLRARLVERIRQEIQPHVVRRIEQANVRAGTAQLLLDYAVAVSQVSRYAENADDPDNAWSVLDHVRDVMAGTRTMQVPEIPPAWVSARDYLLFQATVPQAGGEAWLNAPSILLQSALDAACRQADSFRERKSELTTERLLKRLRSEAERLAQKVREGAT